MYRKIISGVLALTLTFGATAGGKKVRSVAEYKTVKTTMAAVTSKNISVKNII